MRQYHPAVAARFFELYGFVLSEQVALLAALFTSLDEDEQRAARALELAPAGITSWFTHGIDRPVRPGLDARLHYRYWCDPPEVVTLMTGGADGLHLGLFHDTLDKPGWLVVQCYARADGVTSSVTGWQTTILDHLHILVRRGLRDGLEVEPLQLAIEELSEASADIVDREHRPKRRRAPIPRYDTVRGTGPVLPPKTTPSPSWPAKTARMNAYREDDTTLIQRWIDEARAELERGDPGLAMLVGTDLFFLRTRYQTEAVELLTRGYEALGRAPLAALVRLHHAHRDLASVDVFA